jgi:hypothetical protein
MRRVGLIAAIFVGLGLFANSSLAQIAAYSKVSDRGVVYLFGNRLSAPYLIQVVGDTIWINSYQAKPGPAGSDSLPERPESRSRWEALKRIRNLIETVPESQLDSQLSEVLDSLSIVSKFEVKGTSLTLWWKNDPVPELFLLKTSKRAAQRDGKSWTRDLIKVAAVWSSSLEAGKFLFIARSGVYHVFKSSDARADIEALDRLNAKKLESREWKGHSLPYGAARDIVAPFPLMLVIRKLQ